MRVFLRRLSILWFTALAACAAPQPAAAPDPIGKPQATPVSAPITFFPIADPQINIPRWGTAGTERTIELMNELPGTPFPFGGVVAEPAGVMAAGDLVDDITNPANWELYKQLFDPERGRARLRFPIYEGM